jgi:hypothetical protein
MACSIRLARAVRSPEHPVRTAGQVGVLNQGDVLGTGESDADIGTEGLQSLCLQLTAASSQLTVLMSSKTYYSNTAAL